MYIPSFVHECYLTMRILLCDLLSVSTLYLADNLAAACMMLFGGKDTANKSANYTSIINVFGNVVADAPIIAPVRVSLVLSPETLVLCILLLHKACGL